MHSYCSQPWTPKERAVTERGIGRRTLVLFFLAIKCVDPNIELLDTESKLFKVRCPIDVSRPLRSFSLAIAAAWAMADSTADVTSWAFRLRHCSRLQDTAKLNPRLTRGDDGRFAAEPCSWDFRRQTEGTAQKLKLVLCKKTFSKLMCDTFKVPTLSHREVRIVVKITLSMSFQTCTRTSHTEGSWASAKQKSKSVSLLTVHAQPQCQNLESSAFPRGRCASRALSNETALTLQGRATTRWCQEAHAPDRTVQACKEHRTDNVITTTTMCVVSDHSNAGSSPRVHCIT